jgi:outer membrane receptor protein involved in Fe transport
MKRALRAWFLIAAITAARSHAFAQDTSEPHDQEPAYGASARVKQTQRSASSYTLQRRDLPRGPHLQAADMLRAASGVQVVQHAGGGKANQYFLRGFDADHGTDLALSVDGVPVNMVSHGHGQGYADLHWVIPELVQRVEVSKGPYDPRFGDFATAGAIDLQTSGAQPENRASVEAGMFHSYRGLVIAGTDVKGLRITGAAEVLGTDGPFDYQEDLQRYNVFTRLAYRDEAGSELSLTVTGYESSWDASGLLPLRAVRRGSLDRFGAIDARQGGNSTRYGAHARYKSADTLPQRWDLTSYVAAYRLSLYSNFTLFSADPVNGDMIHQADDRLTSGFKARYARDDSLGFAQLSTRFGVELRHDRIRNGLAPAPREELSTPVVSARVDEMALGAFGEEEITWTAWLRTLGAVRVDRFSFAVTDQLEDRATLGTRTSAERTATRVSPKAGVVISPLEWLDVYGNFGLGFHSNDARGVVQGVTPLTRATGYEAGLRSKLFDRVVARLAVFRLDLDSELVWVGDAGATDARGATRREGIELEARADILPWLWANAGVTLNRARFVDAPTGERAVPLAPTRTVSAGLTATHPTGAFGKLSLTHLGDRAASPDGFFTAQGFTRLDASAGFRYRLFEVALAVENLTNTSFRESQFAFASRLRGETGPAACRGRTRPVEAGGSFAGCEDIHFTPGTPLAVRASASVFF